MKFKIIYLDDESDLCEIFKESFETDIIKIQTFVNPDEAIKEIQSNPPDLLFLDYRLPSTTGDIIAQKPNPQLLKVLITGDLTVSPQANYLRIFHKPFKFQEMKDFLDSLIKK